MAQTPKKAAAKPAAAPAKATNAPVLNTAEAKQAAASPPAPTKVRAPANAPAPESPKAESGQAIININDIAGGKHTVELGVNGRIHRLKSGSDIPVDAAVLEVLSNSSYEFSVVQPAKGGDKGSAGSSTATGTALRDEAPTPVNGAQPGEAPHELSQVPDAEIVKVSQGAGAGTTDTTKA